MPTADQVDPREPKAATYLGDGLYAEYDGYQIALFASDGYRRTDTVYLEPAVYCALLAYGKRTIGI